MWVWILVIIGVITWFIVTARLSLQSKRVTGRELESQTGSNHTERVTEPLDQTPPEAETLFDAFSRIDSENGRYSVLWRDGAFVDGEYITGFRLGGPGLVVLLHENEMVWQIEVERPNNGQVSDTGYVAIEDHLFGSGLKSEFQVISPDGDRIIRHRLSSTLFRSGINVEGTFAWCITSTSNIERDSRKLLIFALDRPRLLLKIEELWGVPTNLRVKDGSIEIEADNGIVYRLAENGTILNANEVSVAIEQWEITSDHPWTLLNAVERRMERLGTEISKPEHTKELLDLLDRVTSNTLDEKTLARVECRRGDILLASGKKVEALQRYHLALAIDPQVGVDRQVNRLERETNSKGRNGRGSPRLTD